MKLTEGRELKLAIACGPKCPHCDLDTFDDWHHERTLRPGFLLVAITGSIKCHGCGRFFHIDHYADGQTHSTAWCRPAGRAALASTAKGMNT